MRRDWLAVFSVALLASGCASTGGFNGLGNGVAHQEMTSNQFAQTQQFAQTAPAASQQPGLTATERFVAAMKNNPITRLFSSGISAISGDTVSAAQQAATQQLDPISLGYSDGPPSAQLYISMAEVNDSGGNIEQARQMYQKAIAIEPANLTALLGLARMEDRHGRLDEAIAVYQRALTAHPQGATALNDLALCYARKGQLQPSLELLEHAVQLQPNKKLYRNNIAKVLMELNRLDEALTHLAVVHPPAIAHYNLGVLLAQRGRTAEASHYLSIATDIDPQMQPAQALLAQLGQAPAHLAQRAATGEAVSASSTPAESTSPATASAMGNSPYAPSTYDSILPTPYAPATSYVPANMPNGGAATGTPPAYPSTGVSPVVSMPQPQSLPATTAELPVGNAPYLLPPVR